MNREAEGREGKRISLTLLRIVVKFFLQAMHAMASSSGTHPWMTVPATWSFPQATIRHCFPRNASTSTGCCLWVSRSDSILSEVQPPPATRYSLTLTPWVYCLLSYLTYSSPALNVSMSQLSTAV